MTQFLSTRPRMDSVLSKPSYLPSTLITKFVFDLLLEILIQQTHLQGSTAVRNKIEDLLSRVTVLEKHFDSPPNDTAELRLRAEVIGYVVIPLVVLGSEFFSASLRISRGNSSCCAKDLGQSNSPPTLGTMKICSNFSKIYERQCSITRFAPNLYHESLVYVLTRATDGATKESL